MYRQCLRLVLEKGVRRKCGTDVHDEVVYGTMPRMYDVCLVFEQVVDTFNDVPFAQHDFVPHGHEPVLHVSPQSMHKMYAPVEEVLEERLFDVSPVGEDLSVEFFGEDCPHLFVPVIHICACKTKGYDLSAVIAQKVQLEAVTPSHRPLAVRRQALEHLVGIAAQVVAHGYHRGVHKTDAAAFAKALKLHEEHHVEEHAGHEFDKAVVRNGIRKTTGQVLTYIKEVVMLEIGERAEVVTDKYCHYLTMA